MATEIRVLSTMLAAWHSIPSEHQLSGQGRDKRQTEAGKGTGRGRGGGAHLESQLWEAEVFGSLGVQGQPPLPRDRQTGGVGLEC